MEDVHTMLHAWIQLLPVVQDEKHIHHIHTDIWTILCVCGSSQSFIWILSILEPLNRKRHLPKSVSFYHDQMIILSVLLLLQPETCQFG